MATLLRHSIEGVTDQGRGGRVAEGVVGHLSIVAVAEDPEVAKLAEVVGRGRDADPQDVRGVANTELLSAGESGQKFQACSIRESAEDRERVLKNIVFRDRSAQTLDDIRLEARDVATRSVGDGNRAGLLYIRTHMIMIRALTTPVKEGHCERGLL